MDESRARALLRAERAEVATLLRETEESESEAEQAPDSPTDFGDEGLALTEEEDEGDVADQLRERLAAIDRALARIEAGNYGLLGAQRQADPGRAARGGPGRRADGGRGPRPPLRRRWGYSQADPPPGSDAGPVGGRGDGQPGQQVA